MRLLRARLAIVGLGGVVALASCTTTDAPEPFPEPERPAAALVQPPAPGEPIPFERLDPRYVAALEALDRWSYTDAEPLLRPLAEQGHVGAQAAYGMVFMHSVIMFGPPPRPSWCSGFQDCHWKAIHWLTKAATQGHVMAQYWLGHLADTTGPQGWKSPERAAYWFRQAAARWNYPSMARLAMLGINTRFKAVGKVEAMAAALVWAEVSPRYQRFRYAAWAGLADRVRPQLSPEEMVEAERLAERWPPRW